MSGFISNLNEIDPAAMQPTPVPAASVPIVPVVAAAVSEINLNPWNPAPIDPKQQMIIDFSQQSGMNQQWSSK